MGLTYRTQPVNVVCEYMCLYAMNTYFYTYVYTYTYLVHLCHKQVQICTCKEIPKIHEKSLYDALALLYEKKFAADAAKFMPIARGIGRD